MARKPLVKAISIRVSEDEYADILAYIEAQNIAVADLMRFGAKAYIANHPISK
jgi:hypothetical protein